MIAPQPIKPDTALFIADYWQKWGVGKQWVFAMRQFGQLGGKVRYWSPGLPGRALSLLPCCFELIMPDGQSAPNNNSRLADIKQAVAAITTGMTP